MHILFLLKLKRTLKIMNIKKWLTPAACLFLGAGMLASCVPQRKYEDLQRNYNAALRQNEDCERNLARSRNIADSTTASVRKFYDGYNQMIEDTTRLGQAYRKTLSLYDKINMEYERLLSKSKENEGASRLERQEISAQLADTRRRLEEKEKDLAAQERRLNKLQEDLKDREYKLADLQRVMKQKDSVNNALKTRLSSALLGFRDKGLSVTVKNGRVYVSVEEKLLFQSGKYDVNSEGRAALVQLGKALNTGGDDISIMVEGHTDNVPYRAGKGDIKDNLDLSVMRATSVARIMMDEGGVAKDKIVAAGRGATMPIASNESAEGRAKNRRTEIILTPKLSDLYDILEK